MSRALVFVGLSVSVFLLALGMVAIDLVGTIDRVAPSSPVTELPAEPGQLPDPELLWDSTYGRLPLHFEPNQGQADPSVSFTSRGRGYSLYLMPSAAVLALGGEEPSVIRMEFVGGAAGPATRGLGELPGKSNYLIGGRASWRTGIPHYAKVAYDQVYPGIDLVMYGSEGTLEYDFVLEPEADPGLIRLGFEGARGMRLDDNGDLVLEVRNGRLIQQAPTIYQEIAGRKRPVEGGYRVDDSGTVGFSVGDYDSGYPLVIDPLLAYSTYLGGAGEEWGRGIAVDGEGNAYITGYTESADFPTLGAAQGTYGTNSDAFLTKLNPTGSAIIYSTFLGGSGEDFSFGVAVNRAGNAFLGGRTASPDFPTQQAYQGEAASDLDAFVTKLTADGSAIVFSTYLGGSGEDEGRAIAVDDVDAPYITGTTKSSDFPTWNAFQDEGGTAADVFVTRLGTSGTALGFSSYLAGTGNDEPTGIAVDRLGQTIVTGVTYAADFPTENALQGTNEGNGDVFVTHISMAGSALVFSTYFGGVGGDRANGLALDAGGNIFLTGQTNSSDFPTANAFQPEVAGFSDAFVAKLNQLGSAMIYSTYLGGGDLDIASGIALDPMGRAYVTGQTGSTDFPTRAAIQGSRDAIPDLFVTQFTAAGSTVPFSSYLGGGGGDLGEDIAVGPAGSVYIAGVTSSLDFPTTNALQGSRSGLQDAFVAKLSWPLDFFIAATPAAHERLPRVDSR